MVYTQSGYCRYETLGPTGCSQVEILPLTINHSSFDEFYIQACESYEWYDSLYTEPGIYYHVIENTQGCDSLLIMHLEIGDSYVEETSQTGCGEFEWFGTTYTVGGDYEHEIERLIEELKRQYRGNR